MLIDTGNTKGPKCHFFENSRWRRPLSWKIHKRAYLGQFLIDLHQIWCARRYGQYKCHQESKMWLFENSRWRRPPSWKIHKRAYLGKILDHFTPNLECWYIWAIYVSSASKKHFSEIQNGVADILNKNQSSTFWKFKIAAVAVLEIHKRVYLGQFLTNLDQICVLINTGIQKSQAAYNSTFCKFKMAAAFLGIQNWVAAILNKNQLLVYLGQYCILLSTKQHR